MVLGYTNTTSEANTLYRVKLYYSFSNENHTQYMTVTYRLNHSMTLGFFQFLAELDAWYFSTHGPRTHTWTLYLVSLAIAP